MQNISSVRPLAQVETSNQNQDAMDSQNSEFAKILANLRRPIPAKLIKTKSASDKKNNKTSAIQYLEVDAIEDILDWYAPDWSNKVSFPIYDLEAKTVTITATITICGVSRDGQATISLSSTGYGGPEAKASSLAFVRAARRFGVGRYLNGGIDGTILLAQADDEISLKRERLVAEITEICQKNSLPLTTVYRSAKNQFGTEDLASLQIEQLERVKSGILRFKATNGGAR